MKPCYAFDICHEVYANARQVLDHRLRTVQLEASSKHLWRPDPRPRLAEYVAAFALAGQRAPGGRRLAGRLSPGRAGCPGCGEYHTARKPLGVQRPTSA